MPRNDENPKSDPGRNQIDPGKESEPPPAPKDKGKQDGGTRQGDNRGANK